MQFSDGISYVCLTESTRLIKILMSHFQKWTLALALWWTIEPNEHECWPYKSFYLWKNVSLTCLLNHCTLVQRQKRRLHKGSLEHSTWCTIDTHILHTWKHRWPNKGSVCTTGIKSFINAFPHFSFTCLFEWSTQMAHMQTSRMWGLASSLLLDRHGHN